MLIRNLKAGDCLTIDGVVILVKKATSENLKLAIEADDGVAIHHARSGDKAPYDASIGRDA